MFVTPGVVVDGELVTTNLVDINLGIRILLGSSYYEDWANEETFVRPGPARQPGRQAPPVEPDDDPQAAEARPRGRQLLVGDEPALVRQAHRATTWRSTPAAARSRGCGPRRSPNLVDTPYVKATGKSVKITLPATPDTPEADLEWKIPQWSNAIERDRARVYFIAYAAAMALHFVDKALDRGALGRTKVFEDFDVPDEAIGCGFHEAVRGVLSHHLVIRDGKIANYHPYPPTPWNGQPDGLLRDAGPVRGRGQGHADLRGERPGRASAASTSCARCAASTRACRAACTCTSATARRSSRCTRRCSASRTADRRGTVDEREAAERSGGSRGSSRRSRRCPTRPPARRRLTAVQALLDLYGEGLARIVDQRRRRRCRRGRSPATSWSSHLLLAARPAPGGRWRSACASALEEVRPYLDSHGGDVELLGVARRRRAAAAAGQLRGLPVLGDDAQAGDRGRDPRPRRTSSASRPTGQAPAPTTPDAGAAADRARSGANARVRRARRGRRRARCRSSPAAARCVKQVGGEPVLFLRLDADGLRLPAGLPGVRRARSRRRRSRAPS